MFDAISQPAKLANTESITPKPTPAKAPNASAESSVEKQREEKKAAAKKSEISQAFLDTLEKDIEMIHNVGLEFSVHRSTGRTVIKVINKDTGRLIREVPPERVLNLAAKLDEMMGILFDKTV